ncbi:transient receptor potential cation channel subfamily M member 2-like isoform X2 [Octopus bimaculoides]|uniref:transient receptor potential cation channel subfamily M member 2-like isoform X2 n=1 Tax=Octopus bimaculoides TaxID=37653 RepID=UPI0022E37411|nr:transient receptor potential cation channel subfamily M member 2-like isoform X2 [Octopus bimaculoides]
MRNEIVHKFKKNLKIDEINELFNDVIKSLKQLNLLTVYDIQSTEHFDVAIKKAVFKAKNKSKYLQLLLKWRRIYRVLTTMPPDGTHWQDFQMEVYSKHRAFSDDDDADFSMSRPMEDEMDNSDEESEFEFNEFFKQLRREDKMDSSEEKRPDDKSWLETKPEIDTAFAKIFADIISSGHSGYKYGYKNFVKYSIEEESNTNSLKFQRTISYCVPSFPLKASILDDVQECIQEDLKLRNARGEEPSKPSDALGTVKFVGCEKTAKFVRVDHKTPMGMMMHLIALLWNLALPDLLISVTGERKDLQLTPGIEIFLHRLVKAAETTGAWIISTGLHTGVEKHIGKTIHDDVKNKIVTIGIAPWNCVQNKESLVNKGSWPAKYKIKHDSDSTASALDPNHSHFILVDDGTQETSGVETEFRRMFENTITDLNIPRNEYKVSAVVVMIGGELETLKSVYDSLSCNIPVVIVKGTGQAADIMAYAYERGIENLNKINKFTDLRSLQKKLNDDIRKKITQEFEGLEKKEEDNMVDCVVSSLRRPNLLTVFDINSAEDFGVAIFKALFKTKNKCRNLKLTLKWQRIDNALNKLFTDWTSWQIGKLDKFMISVLEEDMTNIVKLFQEYEINLKEWLTEPHIKTVYQLKNTNLTVDSTCEEFLQSKFLSEIHQEQANLSFATKLFLWALFFNRKEMAFLFWKEGMGALPSALIANNLVKSLQEKCKDYGTSMQLQEQAEFYENHAIGILDECLHADEKQTLDLLLLQQKTWDNSSYMQIAFNVNNENFMAHDACQSLLTKIWMGKINKTNNIWKLLLCTLCPLFLFLIKFDDKKQNLDKEPKKTCSKLWLMFRKCMLFYSTPVIKFWISLIFHIIFLGIYSYVLLVELKPQIFYLEWLLIVWVIGILTEEIHQILVKDLVSINPFKIWSHHKWS